MMQKYAAYDLNAGGQKPVIGFYDDEVNINIHENVIEITHDQWLECLNSGKPYWIENGSLVFGENQQPTQDELNAIYNAPIKTQIDILEAKQQRPMREVMLGQVDSMNRVLEIEKQIEALRLQLK